MALNNFLLAFLACSMTIAFVWDLRTSRIPNFLTFSMMFVGLAWHGIMSSISGLGFSAGGLLLGIGILIIPYFAGGMGAGDVKLLGAAGAIIGAKGIIIGAVFSILLGFVYAVVLMIVHYKYTWLLIRRIWEALKLLLLTKQLVFVPPSKDEKQPYLKFGLPIALGTMGYVFIKYSGSNIIQDIIGYQFSI